MPHFNNQKLLLSSLGAATAAFIAYLFLDAGLDGSVLWIKQELYWPAASTLKTTLFTPVFLIITTTILILERLLPVHPEQKTISVGILHDSVWLVLALLFEGIVLVAYTDWLKGLIDTHLSFLLVEQFATLPESARFIMAVSFTDLLAWFQHWLKHKIPWFWYFHEVHHSQRELNLFTDFRFHFFEYLVSRIIVVVPLVSLGISPPRIVAYAVFTVWFTRFYHANIKTNLGIFRYILVTPQSHRVHHSIEKHHQDKNFGVLFSFWDRLFGTQCEDYDVYPETGISDASFPIEKEPSLSSLVVIPLRQLIYPMFLICGGPARKKPDGKGNTV